jgi:hypothetical protein
MIRRDDYAAVGGMPDLRQGEDFILACRLLRGAEAVYIDEPLMIYRYHGTNSSAKIANRRSSIRKVLAMDTARVQIAASREDLMRYPTLFRTYRRLPRFLRLILLFYWRMLYGSSKRKIASDLWRSISPQSEHS